ncbi:MAG: chemotaxis protein, partial [Planctomyces sp.]
MQRLTVPVKLYLMTGVFSLGLIAYGVWCSHTLSQSKVNGPYYRQIVSNKDFLADILPPPSFIIESFLSAKELAEPSLCVNNPAGVPAAIDNLKRLESEYNARHDHWEQNM